MNKLIKQDRETICAFLVDWFNICHCEGKRLKHCRQALIRQIKTGVHTQCDKDISKMLKRNLQKFMKS